MAIDKAKLIKTGVRRALRSCRARIVAIGKVIADDDSGAA